MHVRHDAGLQSNLQLREMRQPIITSELSLLGPSEAMNSNCELRFQLRIAMTNDRSHTGEM